MEPDERATRQRCIELALELARLPRLSDDKDARAIASVEAILRTADLLYEYIQKGLPAPTPSEVKS